MFVGSLQGELSFKKDEDLTVLEANAAGDMFRYGQGHQTCLLWFLSLSLYNVIHLFVSSCSSFRDLSCFENYC
jgi:hypothetical protein